MEHLYSTAFVAERLLCLTARVSRFDSCVGRNGMAYIYFYRQLGCNLCLSIFVSMSPEVLDFPSVGLSLRCYHYIIFQSAIFWFLSQDCIFVAR